MQGTFKSERTQGQLHAGPRRGAIAKVLLAGPAEPLRRHDGDGTRLSSVLGSTGPWRGCGGAAQLELGPVLPAGLISVGYGRYP